MKRNNRFIEIVILSNKIEINDLLNNYLLHLSRLKIRSF